MAIGTNQSVCPTCARLRAAALDILAADGLAAVSLTRLAERAELGEEEARAHYSDAALCLYATYEEVSDSIYEDWADIFAAVPGWRRALAAGARRLLERLASNPGEGRLCFVEILRSDHEMLRRRDASRRRLVELFVRELGRRRDQPEQFRVQLELLIGATFQAIGSVIAAGDVTSLPALAPELEQRAFVFEPV